MLKKKVSYIDRWDQQQIFKNCFVVGCMFAKKPISKYSSTQHQRNIQVFQFDTVKRFKSVIIKWNLSIVLNLTYKFHPRVNRWRIVSQTTWPVYFKCLHVKSEGIWYWSFQEEHLSMGWCGNLDSSMFKSARLLVWRSMVQIPVQVQIFLLKI